jgi:hypothetical protein
LNVQAVGAIRTFSRCIASLKKATHPYVTCFGGDEMLTKFGVNPPSVSRMALQTPRRGEVHTLMTHFTAIYRMCWQSRVSCFQKQTAQFCGAVMARGRAASGGALCSQRGPVGRSPLCLNKTQTVHREEASVCGSGDCTLRAYHR